MGEAVERAATVIEGFGGDLIEHGHIIAGALYDAGLLAAPVDGELRGVLAKTIDGALHATRHIEHDELRDRFWFAEGLPAELTDALMPAITAHVVNQEQVLREEIVREIQDLAAHARDERPSRAFLDGFEKAVALAAHVARGDE